MNADGLPDIDTKDLKYAMVEIYSRRFDEQAFKLVLCKIIRELDLQGKIETIKVFATDGRAQFIPDKTEKGLRKFRNLGFDIYPDERYLDEKLIRHELQHVADRFNPAMEYYSEIDNPERWDQAMNLAANISVDARHGELGLGELFRWEKEFRPFLDDKALFDKEWTNPPKTWPEIEALAIRLLELKGKQSQLLK